MKILIAEDNADDRKVLKVNLEHHGCEVIEAIDGQEGLAMALAHKPDMIISDALMPRMDGFQFLRSAKKDEALKSIPFVFYSAVYTGDKEAELAISLGAEAFIIKPKDPQEFWEELSGILGECTLRNHNEPASELIADEEDFLRKYSNIVAARLEEKVGELEKARATLLESAQSYKNLFSSLRDVLITVDTGRKIVNANQPALRDLFGYALEDIVGQSIRILYADDDGYDMIGRKISDMGEPDGPVIAEVKFRTKNGNIFAGEVSLQKLRDDKGNLTGKIAMIRDITAQKKLEEQYLQAQKMESIGTLASGIAHDFNNILSAIIGYGDIALMKMGDNDPLRADIEGILEAADRASRLTQGLLLFSRKQTSERKPADLNEIIRKLEKFLKRVIGEDIEYKTIITEQPLTVFADSHQLEQVLMNLATNARDTMPEGGTFIITAEQIYLNEDFTSAHGYGIPGPYALITVSDTGDGMDDATRQRIFEPFFTTKEVGKGTGLGLAVVFGIIKQHDGFITVYSEPGKGTTFRIYLPLIASEAMKEARPYQEEAPVRGTETVLVAEDDNALRKLSTTVLSQFGYTVIEAVDGADAVRKFFDNRDTVSLLLLDLVMPKKNGREAYDEIQKIKPGTKVIFSSGYAPDIVRQKASIESGAHVLYKPVSPFVLLRKVREVLDAPRNHE